MGLQHVQKENVHLCVCVWGGGLEGQLGRDVCQGALCVLGARGKAQTDESCTGSWRNIYSKVRIMFV